MRRHLAVGAVELGIVERGLVDGGFEIIRHQQPRNALEELEHAHMSADPIGQRLRPARRGEGVVRGAEHGDEDLRLADLAGFAIDDRHGLAGVVDEGLVAGDMVLPHGGRQAMLEVAVELAEARIAIALGMGVAILLPEHRQIDGRALHLAHQRRPVRLDMAAKARLRAGASE